MINFKIELDLEAEMHLDHIIVIVPNLDNVITEVQKRLDCVPVYGGKHKKYGTHNAILGIRNVRGYDQYIEFLAIDPACDPKENYPLGLDSSLNSYKVVAWAASCKNIDNTATAMRKLGLMYDSGAVTVLHRTLPDGEVISCKIAYKPESITHSSGIVPFLVEWGDAYHPVKQLISANKCEVAAFQLVHPQGDLINVNLQEVGLLGVSIENGDKPSMQLKLRNGDKSFTFIS